MAGGRRGRDHFTSHKEHGTILKGYHTHGAGTQSCRVIVKPDMLWPYDRTGCSGEEVCVNQVAVCLPGFHNMTGRSGNV